MKGLRCGGNMYVILVYDINLEECHILKEKINKLYDQNSCFLCIMDKDVL